MGALHIHIEKAAWTCVGQVEDGSGTFSLMGDANPGQNSWKDLVRSRRIRQDLV